MYGLRGTKARRSGRLTLCSGRTFFFSAVCLCVCIAQAATIKHAEDNEYQLKLSGIAFDERFSSKRAALSQYLRSYLEQLEDSGALPFPFKVKGAPSPPNGALRGVCNLVDNPDSFAKHDTVLRVRHYFDTNTADLTWKFVSLDRNVGLAEKQDVADKYAAQAKRKIEHNANSALLTSPNSWQSSCKVGDLASAAFPPTEFKTIADVEKYFPDLGKQFGLPKSASVACRSAKVQWNQDFLMQFSGTDIEGGLQINYASLEDAINEANVPSFEFAFKVDRVEGKPWNVELIRNAYALLAHLEANFPLSLKWAPCTPFDPTPAVTSD